ncbi:MAG: hypothetical protein KIT39_18260 [Nitrospirales bacterium]|nr:hypothetical protein [Nitrospirales bacterium]
MKGGVGLRDPADFAAAIWPEVSISGWEENLRPGRGTILSQHHPIVIIAEPGRESEAAMRLRAHRL